MPLIIQHCWSLEIHNNLVIADSIVAYPVVIHDQTDVSNKPVHIIPFRYTLFNLRTTAINDWLANTYHDFANWLSVHVVITINSSTPSFYPFKLSSISKMNASIGTRTILFVSASGINKAKSFYTAVEFRNNIAMLYILDFNVTKQADVYRF